MASKNLPLATVAGTGTLMLPQFAPGMLLQSDDLAALGAYSRDLSRLMFRTLFGCGVMCGLVVHVKLTCEKIVITIDPGVAIDCCADPIQVTTTQTITIDPQCDQEFPKCLCVVLCEKNKCCAPRPAMCASDNGDSAAVCTREKYGFEIRVLADCPECACGCLEADDAQLLDCDAHCNCKCVNPELKCYRHHYQGICGCDCCGDSDCACGCECVVLARLHHSDNPVDPTQPWSADHRARRFVRPVLIEDPQVRAEADAAAKAAAAKEAGAKGAAAKGAAAAAPADAPAGVAEAILAAAPRPGGPARPPAPPAARGPKGSRR
ncbi:MAG: hypothetical protein KGO22_06790 [Gammaproteobacteria bacterium]|nr:hypothetical protein [Gammaproteobacteria bacterium]